MPCFPGDSILQQIRQISYSKKHMEQQESSKAVVWLSLFLTFYNVSETPFAIIQANSLQSWNFIWVCCTFFWVNSRFSFSFSWIECILSLPFIWMPLHIKLTQLSLNWTEINRILFFSWFSWMQYHIAEDEMKSGVVSLAEVPKSMFLSWRRNCKYMNNEWYSIITRFGMSIS